MNQKKELVKALELRKKALLGDVNLGYKIHSGHHLRDLTTVIAFLKKEPIAEKLIKNLCN